MIDRIQKIAHASMVGKHNAESLQNLIINVLRRVCFDIISHSLNKDLFLPISPFDSAQLKSLVKLSFPHYLPIFTQGPSFVSPAHRQNADLHARYFCGSHDRV
jgi:hypothetical protein